MASQTINHYYRSFLMWLLPLMFFSFQFVLRLWPGLTMQQLMSQLSIDASQFGNLAAFYYYGYAGLQIPIAFLLDRFSARSVICLFSVACGLAMLLFIETQNFYVAVLARFIIGAGSAAGFLGVSKVASEWFSKDQYAKVIGFTFTIGLMGAIYGGRPVNILVETHGWREVGLVLGIVSIAIGAIIFLFLRSPPMPQQEEAATAFEMCHILALLRSPLIWALGISNLLMVGTLEGFADVWGVPYLMTGFEFSKSEAAFLTSLVFLGMLVGGPVLAFSSRVWGNYPVITACGIGMAIAFAFLLTHGGHSWSTLALLFFVLGILCCYQVPVFSAGSELVPSHQLGIAVAFLNCINMLGGSFFHTVIGCLMDVGWTGSTDSLGQRCYDLAAYEYALAAIPLCAFIGATIVYVTFVWKRSSSRQLAINQ